MIFHELGHFLAARAAGIRVEEFAFGFGPKLIRLCKRGDTEYTIHPVPIGGFVKLAGMEPGQEDIADGFQAQASWKRALVIFAGPFASFVLAVAVFLMVGLHYGFPDLSKPVNRVGMVNPKTEAARVGLKAGDRVLCIDGVKITRGRQMTDLIHAKPGRQVTVITERPGNWLGRMFGIGARRKVIKAVPQWTVTYLGASWSFMGRDRAVVEGVAPKSAAEKVGIKPQDELATINGRMIVGGQAMVDAVKAARALETEIGLMRGGRLVKVRAMPEIQWISFAGARWVFPGGVADEVQSGSPAGRGGIRDGDRITALDRQRIDSGERMRRVLSQKADLAQWKPEIRVRREGKPRSFALDLSDAEPLVSVGYYDAIGLLGFMPEPALVRAGARESIVRGLDESWQRVLMLVRILTSKEIGENIGGPLMIGKVTASAVALGPYWVLATMGGLSLSLAFINLVPIPAVLDGGHLILIAYEAIRRRRLTREQMQSAQMVGLAMIVMLFAFIIYADVTKIIGGQVPQ